VTLRRLPSRLAIQNFPRRFSRPAGGTGNKSEVFGLAHFARDGAAFLLRAGMTPEVWKIPALLRFHELHRATIAVQKNTFPVRLVHEYQPAAVVPEPGELLDEIEFTQAFERCEPGDFRIGQPHLARPATARRATLAIMEDGHERRILSEGNAAKSHEYQALS
jgi:hypothetical protein